MDLNYLYSRQQIALYRADVSDDRPTRQAQRALASFYGSLIARRRADVSPRAH